MYVWDASLVWAAGSASSTHTHRHTYINRGATSVWLCIIDLVTSKVPSPHTFNIHNSAFIGDEQAGPVTWQNHKQWLNKVLKLCHKIWKLAVNNKPERSYRVPGTGSLLGPLGRHSYLWAVRWVCVSVCTSSHTMDMWRLPQNVATLVSSTSSCFSCCSRSSSFSASWLRLDVLACC